jgi:hypothetical protein
MPRNERKIMRGTCTGVFLWTCMLWLSLPWVSALADQLKSSHYEKERELRTLIGRLSEEDLDYELSVTHKVFEDTFLGSRRRTEGYVHRITLPERISHQLTGYDWRFMRGVFPKYLEDPKSSFHAALLWIAWRQENTTPSRWGPGFVSSLRLEPLEKKDRAQWDRDLRRYETIWRGGNLSDPHAYREKLFYEVVPKNYLGDIFSDDIYRWGASIVGKPVALKGKPFAEAVTEFNQSGATTKLQELALRRENLGVWLYYVLSGDEASRMKLAKDFCAWCRKREPGKNDFLAAAIMGLFIVDGYSFDEESGVYNVTERGKSFLDYIVQFPIPENASRLKTITAGGNGKLIEKLMEKHGTSARWRELLANSAEPTLVEFKQRPRMKNPKDGGQPMPQD